MEGKVYYLNMIKVSSPLAVDSPIGKVTIADNGYKNYSIEELSRLDNLEQCFIGGDNVPISLINDFNNLN